MTFQIHSPSKGAALPPCSTASIAALAYFRAPAIAGLGLSVRRPAGTLWRRPESVAPLVLERSHFLGAAIEVVLMPKAAIAQETTSAARRLNAEGRYEYASMDMRSPVGLMTAQSLTRGQGGRIDLTFQPLAFVGAGSVATGQMLRMDQIISHQGADRDVKEQYFTMADGNGIEMVNDPIRVRAPA